MEANGAFDPEKWTALNYTAYIDDYKAQELVVPLYINSGDHDTFDIAYHAAILYQTLREHQPLNTHYLAPATMGARLIATGKIVGGSRTLKFVEGELVDSTGKLIATASGVFKRVPAHRLTDTAPVANAGHTGVN